MKVEELPGFMTDEAAKAAIEKFIADARMTKTVRRAIADTAGLTRWPLKNPMKEAQDILDGDDENPWLGDECPWSTAFGISEVLMKLASSRWFKAGAEHGERTGVDAVRAKITASLGDLFPGLEPEALLTAAAEKLRENDRAALDAWVETNLRE